MDANALISPCWNNSWVLVDKPVMKLLMLLIGLVLILEGLPYVAAPEAMQDWLKKLSGISPSQLRSMGLLAMIIGLTIIFVVQKTSLFQWVDYLRQSVSELLARSLFENRHFGVYAYLFKIEIFKKISTVIWLVLQALFFLNSEEFGQNGILSQAPGVFSVLS